MTSRDTHPATRVMNRCVISGLLSVGILRPGFALVSAAALRRYAVRVGGDGGVHVRVSPSAIPNSLIMEVFDEQGITTDKNTERKIENLFFREDFRRTAMDDVGTLDFPSAGCSNATAARSWKLLSARALKDVPVSASSSTTHEGATPRSSCRNCWGGLGVDSDLAQRVLRRAARAQFPARPRAASRAT